MKEKHNRAPLYFAGSMLVVFAIVVALILMFMNANSVRISDQNRQYLEDASIQTLKRIDKVFESADRSVRLVSRLYELQMDGPEFDYRMLKDMSEPTPFDYIRFVSLDGVSVSGDGTTINCLDREYFIEGTKGNTGVCFIDSSRFMSEAILIFYTPLYYKGEIVGVVNGVITTSHFAENLDTSFFGQSSKPAVCTLDGKVVVSAWDSDDVFSEAQIGSESGKPEDTSVQISKVRAALERGQPISFRYHSSSGGGIAFIAPLENRRFMLIQTFPSTISKALTDRANDDAFKLEIALIVLFLGYLALVAVYYIQRNHKLSRKNDDLSEIVNSVKRLYRRFVIFDLEHNTYEYLKEGDIGALGLPPEGEYSVWWATFRAQHEDHPDRWGNMEDMTVQHLQETLTIENWFSHREYMTSNDRWERLSLIKLDMDSEVTNRILGAVEDITDIKKREDERREAIETAYRTAEAASHAKSEFLSRMSHDIRTPMNAIIGLTAIMGAHLDERERVIDCLSKITSSSKHLLGLINEVLDMSKIESGKLSLSESEFSIPSLVDDLLVIVQPMVNAKRQTLSVHVRDVINEDVIGDNLRLQQVFVNILSNAVKYTAEGGHIVMTVSEHIGKQPLVGEYEFVFEDNGIGMTEEFLQHVFTPFERAEDERVSVTQGTGLGMSIAQSIIRLMGGTIAVESEVDKGSRFTVHVSLKLQEINEEAEKRLAGLPVLVADDEQIACETTCIMLNDLGLHSEWVLTGREAVEKVTEHHNNDDDFFAVILDWKMPGMDGVETAREIRRAVGPDVPIIILSAYDWTDIEAEARAAGVNAFIGKPLFKSRLRGVFVNLVTDTAAEPADPLSAVKERDFTGKRALLVEDNELNQEIAKEILNMVGIEVDVADNGKIAVETFSAAPVNHYDIVFMDIQMPIMNGLESARAIRALDREDALSTPIVAMTANTFNEDVEASLEAGMDQHIGKPLDMNQLMSALDKWLGSK